MIELNAQDFAELFDANASNPLVAAKVMEALHDRHEHSDYLLMLFGLILRKAETAINGKGDSRHSAIDDLLLGLDNLTSAVFRDASTFLDQRDIAVKQLLELPKPRRKKGGS